MVTRRYYDHFVRKTFSPGLRKGLGLGGDKQAAVIPFNGISPEGARADGQPDEGGIGVAAGRGAGENGIRNGIKA